jgi:hypothetical protein
MAWSLAVTVTEASETVSGPRLRTVTDRTPLSSMGTVCETFSTT